MDPSAGILFPIEPSGYPPVVKRGTPACPGCAAPPVRETVGEVAVREGRFRLARCLACGVVSLEPPPSDAVLAAAYDEAYYGPGHERFVTWVERAAVRLALRRARHVARRVAPPARVLDVGCGRGEVLRALVRRGYACSGTERDGRSAERARRESGADVRAGDLAEHRFPDGRFDFVMIWHVLEHLRDPEETLREVRRVLRPGGTLLVECPNVQSWQARLGGSGWFHYDPPRHLHNFGVSSLRRLGERCGFATRAVSTLSLLQGPFPMYQSLLNRFLAPRDALYDTLRRAPSSRAIPLAAKATSFLALPLLGPLSLLLEALATAVGRGGAARLEFERT